jgi:ABC-type lipoprotein export system ATPase subunit
VSSDPVPINIPDKIDDISRLINGNYTGHPGLAAALKSIKHKRSPHNAYILVMGSTGSGKSTLV